MISPDGNRTTLGNTRTARRFSRLIPAGAISTLDRVKTSSILLVDDFEDGLDMYQEYLTYRGYRIVPARTGEEAIVQARAHRPDVILMDLRMPGMTGTDAMRVLRSDPAFQHVPIIALTAHALDSERTDALAAGFDDLIPKPCLPDHLALAVERILATPRTSRAS